jgi:predicted nuclease of predicted toxin-antitoxin system
VKLLFDENLPPRLPRSLADLYPDSAHVAECGLASADDLTIWQYAKDHGLTIVSKDSDFQDRSVLHGHPPKFIWVRAENCSTREIENLLRAAAAAIKQFIEEDEESYLVLGPRRRPGSSRSKK